jgi:hypothetical protein
MFFGILKTCIRFTPPYDSLYLLRLDVKRCSYNVVKMCAESLMISAMKREKNKWADTTGAKKQRSKTAPS